MDRRKKIWKMIAYSLAVIVIAGLSVALALAVNRQNKYRNELENMYEKSFYDTMTSVSLVGVNLDKLKVSNANNMQRLLLNDICRECERASGNLSQLKVKDEPIEDITKFLSQLGDYCNYLSKKVEFDNTLTSVESKNIEEYSKVLNNVWINLQSIQEELMKGGQFIGKFNSDLNYLAKAYHEINNSTEIDFPEINYDGPFSDDVVKRQEPEALKGAKQLSAEQCREKVLNYFSDQNPKVNLIGQSGEDDISMPNYVFKVELKNSSGTMQISKAGGFLLNYQSYKKVNASTLNEEECIAKAENFLDKVGYKNMKNVWTSNYNSILYINFVFEHNSTIVYPDMIKIKIACDTGEILGLEAQNYIYNHKDRNYSDIGIEDIEYSHNKNFELLEKRIAIIPTDFNTEKLVAEYVLSNDNDIYYVYVNVKSLEEEKILKQIDDDGKMLV